MNLSHSKAEETELLDDCTSELEQESVVIQERDDIFTVNPVSLTPTFKKLCFPSPIPHLQALCKQRLHS